MQMPPIKKLACLFLFIFTLQVSGQTISTWTTEQIANANTAKDLSYITNIEKEAVLYINLARLYPQLFVKYELEKYNGPVEYGEHLKESVYKKSLINELKKMKSSQALKFDKELYEDAKCFAAEQGPTGKMGHNRSHCKKSNYAECCSYGMSTGKDIAMQLLIDDKVPSLGHRKNCLNVEYTKIGISVHAHKKWGTCAVLEIIW